MVKRENIKEIIPKIARYKGIIFDLDKTVVGLGVDWGGLKEKLSDYCYSEKKINIEFTPLDQKLFYTKNNFGKEFYLKLLDIVTIFEMDEANYRVNQEFLDYINLDRNQKLAIYSMNTQKCINNIVEKYFIRKPDIIIAKDNCIEPKPTQKDILFILDQWDFKKEEVVFIGDSENDLFSGRKAGITTYLIEF